MVYKNGRRVKKARTKKQEPETKEKVPQSIVARKGAVGPFVAALVKNIRMIMSPNTAIHLTENKSNSIRDFVNIAGPFGVTHIILVSKGKNKPTMRLACFPQGPTLHFQIEEYTLMHDILKLHKKGVDTTSPFLYPPVLVFNNFPTNDKPLELVVRTFQNMFPAMNPEKIHIDHCRRVLLLQYDPATQSILLRHYSVVRSTAGISRAVDAIVNKRRVPNLSGLHDISEYLTNLREDDAFDDDSLLSGASLTSTGSAAGSAAKQSVRLVELGPRMRIALKAVETGLFQGEFLFNRFSKEEEKVLEEQRAQEKKLEKVEKEKAKEDEAKEAALAKQYKEMLDEVSRQRDKKKKEKTMRKAKQLESKRMAEKAKEKAKEKGKERGKEKETMRGKGAMKGNAKGKGPAK